MKKNKKIIKNIFIVLVLIILQSCNFYYKTSYLFKTNKYGYTISYPKNWFLFCGATDASMYEFPDNNTLSTVALLNKTEYTSRTTYSVPKNKFTTSIKNDTTAFMEIFVLNKNELFYKNIVKDFLQNNKSNKILAIDMINENKERINLSFKNISSWYNKNSSSDILTILINIEENRVILIRFEEQSENKLETMKELYRIINSIDRKKLNKYNDDDNYCKDI